MEVSTTDSMFALVVRGMGKRLRKNKFLFGSIGKFLFLNKQIRVPNRTDMECVDGDMVLHVALCVLEVERLYTRRRATNTASAARMRLLRKEEYSALELKVSLPLPFISTTLLLQFTQ